MFSRIRYWLWRRGQSQSTPFTKKLTNHFTPPISLLGQWCGSGSGSLIIWTDPDISIYKQKTFISTFCDFHLTFFFEGWCICTSKKYGNKQKKLLKKTMFWWLLDEKSRILIRIRKSVVRIRESGSVPKFHGSTTLLSQPSLYLDTNLFWSNPSLQSATCRYL